MKLRITLALVAMLAFTGGATAQTPEAGHEQATIAGTALDLLPDINSDTVEVIAHGEIDQIGNLPVVVRNNSDDPAIAISVKADIRDANGSLAGVSESNSLIDSMPYHLEPGDVALVTLTIQGQMPANPSFAFSVTVGDPDDIVTSAMGENIIDVRFGEVTWLTDRIVGEVVNPSDRVLSSIALTAFCFDENGTPTNATTEPVMEQIQAEQSTTFQLSGVFNSLVDCEQFLVTGFGFAID